MPSTVPYTHEFVRNCPAKYAGIIQIQDKILKKNCNNCALVIGSLSAAATKISQKPRTQTTMRRIHILSCWIWCIDKIWEIKSNNTSYLMKIEQFAHHSLQLFEFYKRIYQMFAYDLEIFPRCECQLFYLHQEAFEGHLYYAQIHTSF